MRGRSCEPSHSGGPGVAHLEALKFPALKARHVHRFIQGGSDEPSCQRWAVTSTVTLAPTSSLWPPGYTLTAQPGRDGASVLASARPLLGTVHSATRASLELSGQEVALSLGWGPSAWEGGPWNTSSVSWRLSCTGCVSALWKEDDFADVTGEVNHPPGSRGQKVPA